MTDKRYVLTSYEASLVCKDTAIYSKEGFCKDLVCKFKYLCNGYWVNYDISFN